MRAMVVKRYGKEAIFEETTVEIPKCPAEHLLIRVKATSLNPIDNKILRLALPIAPSLPAILHGDVSGIVEKVGADTHNFHVGDEVFGFGGGVKGVPGATAEFMVVHHKFLTHKPKMLTFEEAAALPLVSITAYEALIDKITLKPKDKILIYGGSGGVGHIAFQIARILEARAIVTVSSEEKRAIVHQLGASETFNYINEDLEALIQEETNGEGLDVVFDTVGGENLKNSLLLTKNNGHLITTNARVKMDLTPFHGKGISFHAVFMLLPILTGKGRDHHHEILKKIASWVAKSQIKVLLDPEIFEIKNINLAHRKFEEKRHLGKIVIRGF